MVGRGRPRCGWAAASRCAVASAYDVGVGRAVTCGAGHGSSGSAGSPVAACSWPTGSFVTAGLATLPALVAPLVLLAQPGREHGAVAVDVVDPAQPPRTTVAATLLRAPSWVRSGSRC